MSDLPEDRDPEYFRKLVGITGEPMTDTQVRESLQLIVRRYADYNKVLLENAADMVACAEGTIAGGLDWPELVALKDHLDKMSNLGDFADTVNHLVSTIPGVPDTHIRAATKMCLRAMAEHTMPLTDQALLKLGARYEALANRIQTTTDETELMKIKKFLDMVDPKMSAIREADSQLADSLEQLDLQLYGSTGPAK